MCDIEKDCLCGFKLCVIMYGMYGNFSLQLA